MKLSNMPASSRFVDAPVSSRIGLSIKALAVGAIVMGASFAASAATITSSIGFVNTAITSQSGSFTASFDAKPSISPANQTLSFSSGAQTAYTGLAATVRFNTTGTIDARNGGAYAAVSSIPFAANTNYHFRVVINVAAHTYSAYVTPPGGTEKTVASNYAFRTEQASVTKIDNFNADVNATPGGSLTYSTTTISVGGSSSSNSSSTSSKSSSSSSSSSTGSSSDLSSATKKEYAMEIVSSAENSTTDWRSQYSYIEDIKDGRGYTAGIIGFCSGTGDMLELVQAYTNTSPSNVLAKYLPALNKVNGTSSHTGLDPNFTSDWRKAAADSVFQRAQDKERDDTYFNPAVAAAKKDGLRALGQFAYYDAAVVHGYETVAVIRARALLKAKPPAQGGNETTYLNAFLDERVVEMKKEAAHSDVSRIETAQRVFLNNGNLDLNAPLSWKVYGQSFSIK